MSVREGGKMFEVGRFSHFGHLSLFLWEKVSSFKVDTLQEAEAFHKLYIGEALLGFIFGVAISAHHFSLFSASFT